MSEDQNQKVKNKDTKADTFSKQEKNQIEKNKENLIQEKLVEKSADKMFEIGHIKSALGLRGEVWVYVKAQDISWASELKAVLLKKASAHRDQVDSAIEKNFAVEKWRPHKGGISLKLSGVDDRTAAESLKSMKVCIDQSLLISKPGETIFLSEILGFQVQEFDSPWIYGEIIGFSSNGPQDLLEIKNESGIFSAPFVKEFIHQIDFQNKTLWVLFPEGLDPRQL